MTTVQNATQQATGHERSLVRDRFARPGPRRSADAQLRLLLDDDDLLTVHLDGAPVGRRLALRLGGAVLTPLPQLLFQILLEHLSLRPPGAPPSVRGPGRPVSRSDPPRPPTGAPRTTRGRATDWGCGASAAPLPRSGGCARG